VSKEHASDFHWKSIHLDEVGILHVYVSSDEWNAYQALTSKNCDHSANALRERILNDGGTAWYKQCLNCGRAASQAIKRQPNQEIEKWDVNLVKVFDDKIDKQKKALEKIFISRTAEIQTGSSRSYEDYLQSEVWREKRLLVLQRDNFICQGCLKVSATEVHHLNYEDVPNELLFDLISLCSSCHKRAHRREIERTERLKAAEKASLEKEE
jgi:5-methylcytosine-specific restriction endonuclease McrA